MFIFNPLETFLALYRNLRASFMLIIKTHKCTPTNEQVAFIKLKRAIYNKAVQLRKFAESDLEHSKDQKKVRFR